VSVASEDLTFREVLGAHRVKRGLGESLESHELLALAEHMYISKLSRGQVGVGGLCRSMCPSSCCRQQPGARAPLRREGARLAPASSSVRRPMMDKGAPGRLLPCDELA
jgi:hypothetical protein